MTLIDKAALLNRIATEVHYDSEHSLEMYAKLLSEINDAPTVDAEPVRQGHWIEIHDLLFDYIRCSECGEDWCTEDNDTETFNYCPNCGAEMDEVRGERV